MKRLVLAASAAAILAVAAAYFLPLAAWALRLVGLAREAGWVGVGLVVLLYVLSAVALVPASVVAFSAGFAYGPALGLAIASPATAAGAATAFLLGRNRLRDRAQRLVARSRRARAIDAAVAREGFKLVLLLRLSPVVPFTFLNYALSVSRVPLRTFVLASWIGMLPGTAFYVYLGSAATAAAQLRLASDEVDASRWVLYFAGLAATLAVVIIGTRTAGRYLRHDLLDDSGR